MKAALGSLMTEISPTLTAALIDEEDTLLIAFMMESPSFSERHSRVSSITSVSLYLDSVRLREISFAETPLSPRSSTTALMFFWLLMIYIAVSVIARAIEISL